MASEAFVDTSGFFAALSPHDQWHDQAQIQFERLESLARLVTTDYILSETATLLRSRCQSHLIEPWLGQVLQSARYRIVWMNSERFDQVRQFFAKHDDKQWSFTDCFSFCVMQERKMRQALASDEHFRQAGFEPLLSG